MKMTGGLSVVNDDKDCVFEAEENVIHMYILKTRNTVTGDSH